MAVHGHHIRHNSNLYITSKLLTVYPTSNILLLLCPVDGIVYSVFGSRVLCLRLCIIDPLHFSLFPVVWLNSCVCTLILLGKFGQAIRTLYRCGGCIFCVPFIVYAFMYMDSIFCFPESCTFYM